MALAFKEWSYIVGALGEGYQNIILRKGGIHEESNDFEIKGNKFFLFPTLYHQGEAHIKDNWYKNFKADTFHPEQDKVSIQYFAEIADTRQLTDWPVVEKLFPYHAWKEEIISERFNRWEKKVHLLIVQVYKLNEPKIIHVLPEYGGCKSWIELDEELYFDGEPVKSRNIR